MFSPGTLADTCSDTSLTGWPLVKSIDAIRRLPKKTAECAECLSRAAPDKFVHLPCDLRNGFAASRGLELIESPASHIYARHRIPARFRPDFARHRADAGTEHDLPDLALDHAGFSGRHRFAWRCCARLHRLHAVRRLRHHGAAVCRAVCL